MPETNITGIRIPTGGRQASWLFKSVVEDLNLRTTVNKSSWRSERDLKSGLPNCKSGALTTRPRCLRCTLSLQLLSPSLSLTINYQLQLVGCSLCTRLPQARITTLWLLALINWKQIFRKNDKILSLKSQEGDVTLEKFYQRRFIWVVIP